MNTLRRLITYVDNRLFLFETLFGLLSFGVGHALTFAPLSGVTLLLYEIGWTLPAALILMGAGAWVILRKDCHPFELIVMLVPLLFYMSLAGLLAITRSHFQPITSLPFYSVVFLLIFSYLRQKIRRYGKLASG